jgi:hypothetical protein
LHDATDPGTVVLMKAIEIQIDTPQVELSEDEILADLRYPR